MKNLFIYILTIIAFSFWSCDHHGNPGDGNYDFELLKEDFLQTLWILSPELASGKGLSQYDSIVSIKTVASIEKSKATADSLLNVLNGYSDENLGELDKIDLYMMRDYLNRYNWYLSTLKTFEWDPSRTNIGNKLGRIMNRRDSIGNKLKTLSAVLSQAPAYYLNGLENIRKPTREHLELAIKQNNGASNYLNSLVKTVEESTIGSTQKEELRQRIEQTQEAIQAYIQGLELIAEKGDFRSARLGEKLFEQKYRYDINAEYTAKEIYQKALEEKQNLHRQMITISDTLWSDYLPAESKPADPLLMVKMLIDKISEDHVEKDSFFVEINRQIKELAAFVDEKELLTQDPTKPLQVRETPEYMRGVSGASISPPGPFEKEGTTFYNVTPLDDYSDDQAESYLREYNDYILQILNIHEAIPGHYTQLVYSRRSKSLIKSVLSNGAMIEGWANYTEIMMLEEGYNNSSEMWLMRSKWHLRGVTNTIIDYSYHVLGLTEEEAMSLMMDGAFQERTEAEGKWIRLTVSAAQLSSYFTGFTQIYSLREELKAKKGEAFDLKAFHEDFLSYGSAPVKYIREFMLAD